MYLHVYRAEPKEPTQFGSVSGSEIHNLPFSHSSIVSLYRSEQKISTQFGSVSGLEIQNICISRNLDDFFIDDCHIINLPQHPIVIVTGWKSAEEEGEVRRQEEQERGRPGRRQRGLQ